ncbi:hypothetical protein [Paenibacillus qinlingensis]|uniref:hypothetical protein n=1 Tax=Paenibacillus qinlingensis TaxID=1837343 RepID=UPI0037C92988
MTGNFTAPTTGRYTILATINYATTAAVSVSIGAGVNPFFAVQRTSPSAFNLVSGYLPILNVNVALVLTLRAVLGTGEITLAGDVILTAGDVVGLFYNAAGLAITINIGNAAAGVVWSIHQIA